MVKFSLVSESALGSVIDSVNRKIVELKRNYTVVKVGITKKNPQDCFQEHLKHTKWKRFIIIYQDTAIENVYLIKQQLIECHFFDNTPPKTRFSLSSCNSLKMYVYVLLK